MFFLPVNIYLVENVTRGICISSRVILDIMDHLGGPQGKYSESFVLIYLLEVCQEWGVKNGGTWRTESSLTLWMYLVDPKDHILKILCHYLNFWLSYKHMSRLSQNVTHTQTDTWQIYIRYGAQVFILRSPCPTTNGKARQVLKSSPSLYPLSLSLYPSCL